jgi:hypothetical protein
VANIARAASRFALASAKVISGYGPIDSSFSLPPNRNLNCYSREPLGLTNTNKPSKSETLKGFSLGLRLRTAASLSGIWGYHLLIDPLIPTPIPPNALDKVGLG